MAQVIYYKEWHLWYQCSVCKHDYGYEDPLHTHWCQCCPSCGVKSDSFAPPTKVLSRRFCCTKIVTWWQKLIGKKRPWVLSI